MSRSKEGQSGAASSSGEDDVLDPHLVRSILPRLQRIVGMLQQAAKDGQSLSTPIAKEGGAESKLEDNGSATSRAKAEPEAATSSTGPSIALGAVSEDDHSLYDFLFSSSSAAPGDAASSSTPTELSLSLLREARELRDVYRKAEKACRGMEGAKWGIEEQTVAIRQLEGMRAEERRKARFEATTTAAETAAQMIPAKRVRGSEEADHGRPMGAELLLHFRLSSQIVQALLTSLQSSFSGSALPPDPIPRPGKQSRSIHRGIRQDDEHDDELEEPPSSLASLPIWSGSSASSSITPATLLPSLIMVHASLDEALLRARTHRANTVRIASLSEEVGRLRRARRERVRKLRDAAGELRELLARGAGHAGRVGEKEAQSGKGGQVQSGFRLVNRADVLAYAAELARTTSAPPGWGGAAAILAKEKVGETGAAVPTAQGQDGQAGEQTGEDTSMRDVAEGDNKNGEAHPSSSATPAESATPATTFGQQQSQQQQQQQQQQPPQPAGGSSSLLLLALAEQQNREAAANGSASQAPLVDPAASTSSAPYTLPFPSDADMRRGLMGVAMLTDMARLGEAAEGRGEGQADSAMSGLLPSWKEWGRLKREEEEVMRQSQRAQEGQQQQREPQERRHETVRRPAEHVHSQDAGGFGLDL
ncbi:hypothetical protein BDZ90DRAFT_258805 [Jaminaea rosea]|uniref:Mediator of RNA polymerase II transcription subunit 4 n=1 Tax=Jaminaea rosea TaxID=1569628 RepID=A0A316UTT9_9BASI|nr:hypothetical protein BDZ90DRAFT_258805 [Jaminaea rosea]PWN28716.1 hypothetical protein BDZ90DRAFT_258805 [Jaminaea rosea]